MTFLNDLPLTQQYIKKTESDDRKGHHVHVAKREAMSSTTPISKMTASELQAFDQSVSDRLKALDND